MSNLLFGAFHLAVNFQEGTTSQKSKEGEFFYDALEKLSFNIVSLGLKHNLHLSMGFNISQKFISDVLKQQLASAPDKFISWLPFFITHSPIHNASDELLSQWEIEAAQRKKEEMRADILVRLCGFLKECTQEFWIDQVVLFYSSNYDVNFDNISAQLSDLPDMLYKIYRDNECELPSMKLSLQIP